MQTLKTRFSQCVLSAARIRYRCPSVWPQVVVYISTGRWQKYWIIPIGLPMRADSNKLFSIRVLKLIPRVQLTLVPFCESQASTTSKQAE